jgi:hypothetical protein
MSILPPESAYDPALKTIWLTEIQQRINQGRMQWRCMPHGTLQFGGATQLTKNRVVSEGTATAFQGAEPTRERL